eukprot:14482835-Ditylum_brightwellii.AAC.1
MSSNTHQNNSSSKTLSVLRQLSDSISGQNKHATTTNKLMEDNMSCIKENDDKKKDRLKKLHPSILKMIKMVSSTDGDKAADTMVQTCKDFMNCESAGLANQTLCFHFKDIGLNDVSFAHGLTQALYTGSFLYVDVSTPSNFSAFCFFESFLMEVMKMEERSPILHLIATQGQGKSLADIKASAKHTVKVPSSFDALTNQLDFWVGAFQIFFGTNSVGTMKMKKLIEKMWLDKCLSADDRLEVDDSNLFFNNIINKILLGEYNVDLLTAFNFDARENERDDKKN